MARSSALVGRRFSLLALLALVAVAGAARAVAAPADDAAIHHLLDRLTYGPRPGDVDRVRSIGASAFIEQQLAPERLDDAAVDATLRDLRTLTLSIPDLLREYPRPEPGLREKVQIGEMSRQELMDRYPLERRPGRIVAELQAARVVRAVASPRQLNEVMVDFWLNHFNVFSGKGAVRWYLPAWERDVVRPHALGRFPELLAATARHPAMLFYLDNWLSARPDFVIPAGPQRGRRAGLNENYARELMELHTLGVDGGYTQQDVRAVARAFTGWTIERPYQVGRFLYRPGMHDAGDKVVLGRQLAAGGGVRDGERVLDMLARHPSTARFLATKLVRRFVADDPPPALVEQVAATYQRTGGDVRAMLRTIFTAPEFLAPEARGTKTKKPFEFVVSAVRSLGGTVSAEGGMALARAAAQIGEPLYGAEPPTGHPDRAEPWINPGALLARMNFALSLAHGRVPGVQVNVGALTAGVDRREPQVVLDRLLGVVLPGGATEATRAVLSRQLGEPQITRLTPDDRGPANTDVEMLLALVIGAPEFQRR
jgi:uncharacterized protein (DUF1800 family)